MWVWTWIQMSPRTVFTLCWYESQRRLVKAKILKSGHISSFPSLGHGYLTAFPQNVQHLGCHPATGSWQAQNMPGINQPTSQCFVLPRYLEIHFFLAEGKGSRVWPQGSHPIPCTQVATAPSLGASFSYSCNSQSVPLSLCPTLQKGSSSEGGHELILYLVLHCNKSHLDWVPPLEQSHFSMLVRYLPQIDLTTDQNAVSGFC